jgi:PleD family two-component response regulator
VSRAILVVRDKTDFAARLEEALGRAGIGGEIVIAGDATTAAALFGARGRFGSSELPAMVIVPPLVDVLALLKTLRAEKRTQSIPVFVLRLLPEPEDER